MRLFRIDGNEIELSEHDYLLTIQTLAQRYLDMAVLYHNLHVSGFSDWKGILQVPDKRQIELKELDKAIIDQIDDEVLLEVLNYMISLSEEIKVVDRNITQWLGEYVGLTSIQSKKEKGQLEQLLKKIVVGGPGGRTQGPVWANQSEYQALLESSKKVVEDISKTHLRLEHRIQFLTEKFSKK
jgi:hypothetical protein